MEKYTNSFKELLPYIVILIVVILLKAFVFTTIRVNGNSMYPTLKNKDLMILDKISYRFKDIKRNDIVVVKTNNDKLIKRVIGLPGEKIKYQNNKLYINEKEFKDIVDWTVTNDFDIKDFGVSKIPDGYYFVMGDNRTDSVDSRMLGLISKEDIMGHATFTIYPFSRFGFKK